MAVERTCACGAKIGPKSRQCRACMIADYSQPGHTKVSRKPRTVREVLPPPGSEAFIDSELRNCAYCMRKYRGSNMYCTDHEHMEQVNRGYMIDGDD